MTRRHERNRRDASDPDLRDPALRVIRHCRYECFVIEDAPTWREKIARLDANTASLDALEDEPESPAN